MISTAPRTQITEATGGGSPLTVIRQSPAVLQLLSGKDESLLVWRDALFVLDLGFHVVDRVRGLDLEGDGLTREAE